MKIRHIDMLDLINIVTEFREEFKDKVKNVIIEVYPKGLDITFDVLRFFGKFETWSVGVFRAYNDIKMLVEAGFITKEQAREWDFEFFANEKFREFEIFNTKASLKQKLEDAIREV